MNYLPFEIPNDIRKIVQYVKTFTTWRILFRYE